jgi:histone-lysine N-methyltransferase SETD2
MLATFFSVPGEELTFDYNFERYGDKPMRCFCGSKKCRKFIGGTQESTANIVELGDAEDVTNDPEPVMVREEETDAMVQAMLDKEVGTTQRAWDNKLLNRCGAGLRLIEQLMGSRRAQQCSRDEQN